VTAELDIKIVRSLTEDDIPKLSPPSPLDPPRFSIAELREPHHRMARLVRQGLSDEEVARQVGSPPQTVANLRRDPAFRELVAGYREK
jgi:hypothetical protein